MPVDHEHSRFGPKAGLGTAALWLCPACGAQNEGRAIEQGCGHCGSGDPSKGQAGSARVERSAAEEVPVQSKAPTALPLRRSTEPTPSKEAPLRILRLIEYLVHPGQDFDPVLRRSLVGKIDMQWGSLTATIVDSCDARQEDLLGLARKQPGVWLANPAAMETKAPGTWSGFPQPREFVAPTHATFDKVKRVMQDGMDEIQRRSQMEMPDTGPAFTTEQATLARNLSQFLGLRLINTLALALGSIAEELAGNAEPHKFLSREECLSFANALLHEIPDDWQGEGQEVEPPDPTPVQVSPAVEERLARIREGSLPTATPWVDPTTRPGVL